jgi:protease I
MSGKLTNKRVAILATDGVEQVELLEPKQALDAEGAKTEVISPKDGKIKGWNHTEWGTEIPVDRNLQSADPNNYDALFVRTLRLCSSSEPFSRVRSP